jgi:pilus assembly protein Flp/PilA
MLRTIQNLIHDESGATALEYGLIAALVSVAAIGALHTLGDSLNGIFGTVSDQLNSAATSAASSAAP